MSNSQFLNWIADRLVMKYGESENVDFVQRLRSIAGPEGREHKTSLDCWCNPKVQHVSPASRGVFP